MKDTKCIIHVLFVVKKLKIQNSVQGLVQQRTVIKQEIILKFTKTIVNYVTVNYQFIKHFAVIVKQINRKNYLTGKLKMLFTLIYISLLRLL